MALSDDDVKQIGQFIVDWNLTELQVDLLASMLLSVSPKALAAIMGSPNVSPRADILIALAHDKIDHDKELAKDIEKAAKKLKGLSNFRNAVAHGRWAVDLEGSFAAKQANLMGPRIRMPDVRAKTKEVKALSATLAKLFDRHQAHIKAQNARMIADLTKRIQRI